MTKEASRDYGLDNIKCILMACVVIGHLLEFCSVGGGDTLYRLVYLFHMPLFVFLSGYFARSGKTGAIVRNFLVYLVFQTLYIAFEALLWNSDPVFQYATPYWILWYMLAYTCYLILLPLYEADSTPKRIAELCVTCLLSLLAGYDSSVGYGMSLSRFFVFQPFFLLGYYWKNSPKSGISHQKLWGGISFLLVLVLSAWCLADPGITRQMMYGSYPYASLNYGPIHRFRLMLTALSWILFMMLCVKPALRARIPLVSAIGANTLSVYLLHGFVMKLGQRLDPGWMDSRAAVIGITAACLVVFGNPVVGRWFKRVFYGPWRPRSE